MGYTEVLFVNWFHSVVLMNDVHLSIATVAGRIILMIQFSIYTSDVNPLFTTNSNHANPIIFQGNSSAPRAVYMRQWTGSALVQVMACRPFGVKPLPEPMIAYCQLDSWEQISANIESELYHFHSRKCIWNCRLPKWRPFCPAGGCINVM